MANFPHAIVTPLVLCSLIDKGIKERGIGVGGRDKRRRGKEEFMLSGNISEA